MKANITGLLIFSILFIGGCKKDQNQGPISLLSGTINNEKLVNKLEDVSSDVTITLVFSEAVSLPSFKSLFEIKSTEGAVPIEVSNSASYPNYMTVKAHLGKGTKYTVRLPTGVIGKNSEKLETPFQVSFTTAGKNVISSETPCKKGCENEIPIYKNAGEVELGAYLNYPAFEVKGIRKNLKNAVIVVHGVNRNADDYFSFLSDALEQTDLEENTLLIAPWFKTASDAGQNELYWNSSDWRQGRNSDNSRDLSSIEAIDSVIGKLANKTYFPSLERIIITGHSSGAAFTDIYAVANRADDLFPDVNVYYVIANSQFFYYPNDYRYDESTGQFYKPNPSACSDYNHWPFGYKADVPSYLNGVSEEIVNNQFAARNVIYLLGNGHQPDPSLSQNCHSSILGSTRFKRGENMYKFMNEYFPNNKQSKKIVQGIGHDGEGMYSSPELKNLLESLLE